MTKKRRTPTPTPTPTSTPTRPPAATPIHPRAGGTEPPVVTVSRPEDLLALVPHLLGYRPSESLVLLGFAGKRSAGGLRIDLPRGEPERIAPSIIATLRALPGVRRIVPVVYTDEGSGLRPGDRLPGSEFMTPFLDALRRAGYDPWLALWVGPDAFASYLDAVPVPRPIAEVEGSAVGLRATTENGVPPALESSWTLPLLDDSVLDAVARAFDEYSDRHPHGRTPSGERMRVDVVFRRVAAAASIDRSPGSVARMLYHLQDPLYPIAVQAILGWRGDVLAIDRYDPPNVAAVDRGIELLRYLAAAAPVDARVAVLELLAELSWTIGRGSAAGGFADAGLAIDPHSIVLQRLHAGLARGAVSPFAVALGRASADRIAASAPDSRASA